MNPSTALAQSALLIQALQESRAFRHPVTAITLVETHISWILLTGRYAYKIKKPVDFGFLDFSTLAQRRHYCAEEIRLNRRLAESLYLDVVAITGSPDRPVMGGEGEAIEYAVKMRQFEAGQLLSERAQCGRLGTDEIDQIAALLSRFHERAEVAGTASPYGEAEDIRHWAEENFVQIAPLSPPVNKQSVHGLEQWSRNEWRQKAEIMRERKIKGFIRECHGDLHLGNMTFIQGRVVPFDCIEFNPQLRWIDVVSELAFLVMDLTERKREGYGFRLLNAYLQRTGDYAGLALLRYYLVYRAMVRAKVALLRLRQTIGRAEQKQILNEYRDYLGLAERWTQMTQPRLMIMYGYSGAGKSFVARALAESLGAIQLRSDIERKRLFGFAADADTGSGLGSGLYTPEAGRKTFGVLAELTESVLRAGFDVIVDATFLRASLRDKFRRLARDCGVPFVILEVKASEAELLRRIEQRRQEGRDASEADEAVLQQQLLSAEPLTAEERKVTVTIDSEDDQALTLALKVLAD